MSKRNVLILAAVAVLALVAYMGRNKLARVRVRDTQLFVAGEAAKFVAAHPDATETEVYAAAGALLKRLREASVTDAWFDSSGQLVDPWGSRFLLVVDTTAAGTVATCTSLGPDRRADTWDDIVQVYSEPGVGQANPALHPTPPSRRG